MLALAPAKPAATAPSTPITLIGIDPGLRRTGYAIVRESVAGRPDGRLVEAGLVKLDPKASLENRLAELEHSLVELLDRHTPQVLACEQLYAHYKHPRTAILMGHARGVILALAARRHIRVLSIASTHVKKFLTGGGHATKPQMQRAVAFTLGLPAPPQPHDVADAIAIGLCGLRMLSAEGTTASAAARGARR